MKKLLLLSFILSCSLTYSQVAINKNGNAPDGSALLDVQSTNAGILIPRMTASERDAISNPATGLLVYVTGENNFYYYDGSAWVWLSQDNLGNHKATQNLEMQGHWISNDGDDEGIYVNDEGNIGIGTDNLYANNQGKTSKLHILMNSSTSNVVLERNQDGKAPSGLVFLRSRGDDTNKTALQDNDGIASFAAYGYDGAEYKHAGLISYKVDGAVSSGIIPTKIIFNTQSQNDFSERVTIKNDGKVGIGTTEPVGMLHIKGDDADIDLDINSSSNPKKVEVRFKEDGTQKAKMYYQKNTGDFIFEQLAGKGMLKFSIGFIPAMSVDQNRNVGIGTTTPESTLEVSSASGNISIFRRKDIEDTDNSYTNVIKGKDKSGDLTWYLGDATTSNKSITLGARGENGDYSLQFETNSAKRMTIAPDGNVGVGVTSPKRTLHIKDVLRINPSDEPANPSDGDIYLDSTSHKLRCYSNGSWHDLW